MTSLETVGREAAIAQLAGGRALRTLDRGRTWRRFRLRFTASFATPNIGLGFRTYFVENHSVLALVETDDGGTTWRRRASPCAQLAFSALIDLVTPQRGWVVCLGQGGAGQEEKAVFRTTDGGRTWRAGAETVVYPHRRVHGGIFGYGYPIGIAFARDGFGILWESRGTLYVTRDGGRRWTSEPTVARPEIDFGHGAAALPRGSGFVLISRGGGTRARLLMTNNYGRSWKVLHRWR